MSSKHHVLLLCIIQYIWSNFKNHKKSNLDWNQLKISTQHKNIYTCTCMFVITCIHVHVGQDSFQVASDILQTVTDPRAMVGPEVKQHLFLIIFTTSSSSSLSLSPFLSLPFPLSLSPFSPFSLLCTCTCRLGSLMNKFHVTTLLNWRRETVSFVSSYCTTQSKSSLTMITLFGFSN